MKLRFKPSTNRAIRTIAQMVIGFAAALPIFLTTSGIPADVGGGGAVIAITGLVAKAMNLVEDELEDK